MTSNALSSRRQLSRRPKVCKYSAGTPVCRPPRCEIEPDSYNLSWGESTDVRFYAVAGNYPYPTDIVVTTVAQAGLFFTPVEIFNDDDAYGAYQAPSLNGLFLLIAEFTWPNAEYCKATVKISVTF